MLNHSWDVKNARVIHSYLEDGLHMNEKKLRSQWTKKVRESLW